MTAHRFLRIVLIISFVAAILGARAANPQPAAGTTLDLSLAPGNNYDKAEFRLWYPNDAAYLQAAVVLMPGSNGDGRGEVADPAWQSFAARHSVALVGCRLTDKLHDQNFIEEYVAASRGSGQALLDVLADFGGRSNHPELAGVPLLLWGMSAGGEFNYEFVAWKPERVVAFVVNKGGIYYTALASKAARSVPGILFVGGKDLEFRTNTIVGLFAVNRRAGALWALAEEPSAAHVVGRSRDMAAIFFEDALRLRVGEPGSGAHGRSTLRPLEEKAGFIGDPRSKAFRTAAESAAPNYPTSWLLTERVAGMWQALVTEKPFAK